MPNQIQRHSSYSRRSKRIKIGYAFLSVFFILNFFLWSFSKSKIEFWVNVPPAPGPVQTLSYGLGDAELSYRLLGYQLQNMGDHGGQTRNIDDYNYKNLAQWARMLDGLNQKSDFLPNLAAHYFGSSRQKDHILELVQVLEDIGLRDYPGKWQWLVWSMTKSDVVLSDYEYTISLARQLQSKNDKTMPGWGYRMAPMYMFKHGDLSQSYLEMMHVYYDYLPKMPHDEKLFAITFLCDQLSQYSDQNPACFNALTSKDEG